MAHLTLRIGDTIIVPFAETGRRETRPGWRMRCLPEAAGCDRQVLWWPAPLICQQREGGRQLSRASTSSPNAEA